VTWFKSTTWNLHGGIEESHEKYQSGYPVSRPIIEPGTSRNEAVLFTTRLRCWMRSHWSVARYITPRLDIRCLASACGFQAPRRQGNDARHRDTYLFRGRTSGSRLYRASRHESEALRLWPQRCHTVKPTRCYNSLPQVQSKSCKTCNSGSGCSFYRTPSR
jgi:hypothetical protein